MIFDQGQPRPRRANLDVDQPEMPGSPLKGPA